METITKYQNITVLQNFYNIYNIFHLLQKNPVMEKITIKIFLSFDS